MVKITDLMYDFLDAQDNKKHKIAIIGDVIIDEYYKIKVDKISSEFPIPIMQSSQSGQPHITKPGGAGNVASQLCNFNTNVTLFGIADQAAAKCLKDNGIKFIFEEADSFVPRKKRFYTDNFSAVCRWDIEDDIEDSPTLLLLRKRLFQKIERYIEQEDPSVVILSDYGKGLFDHNLAKEIITLCNYFDIPTIVDPKSGNIDKWSDCTIFKPNHKEALNFAKLFSNDCIEKITDKLNCTATVVTHGEKGVYVYEKSRPSYHYTLCQKIDLRSEIGAGDCFAAIFALAYACKFNIQQCSMIAHNAGSVYVQHKHNKSISPFDLEKYVDPIEAKIQSQSNLSKILKSNFDGKKVVMTNGCFDLLHIGHIECIKTAKECGDILVVAVDSDENVARLKGKGRPVDGLDERMLKIASLSFVDFVTSFTGNPDIVINNIPSISVLVKGKVDSVDKIIGGDLVDDVVIVPELSSISTTSKINKIQSCPH